MRFFGETHIDFLGKRYYGFVCSAIVLVVGFGSLIAHGGPRLGIDFAGGSQIVVRFAEQPELNELRDLLAGQGLEDAVIQEFEAASNEVLIRTKAVTEEEEIDVAVSRVRDALDRIEEVPADEQGQLDLNTAGQDQVLALLLEANPLGFDLDTELERAEDRYLQAVETIFSRKAELGLITSMQQLQETGVDAAILDVVDARTRLGDHAIVNSESVGPQVGQDLRRQAIQAISWALVGMLAYISYRFEFKFGVAAVIALVHDVSIALGAFSLTNREFNLPVIAAFLTIVGYSLNDTVVVFDRIRENATAMRRSSLYDRINTSLNQTLSRTLLTSTTTLIVVLALYLYGGPVINDFSFALLVGVLVGTYSSLFVASPVVYMWQERERQKRKSRPS